MTQVYSIKKSETEFDLVRALQQNERKAQTRVYEKYSSKMLAVCTRYVGNRTEAEDVMIEGFMRIFDKIGQFNFQGSFEGWMRKLMVNEALMFIRSKKIESVELDYISESIDYKEVNTNLEAEELIKLIEALPTGYRMVFNLFAIEGYNHNEISAMLGISEGTSKSQLSRARAILQEKIKANFQKN